MLIIERKAGEFPPDGRIPADDETVLKKFADEVAEVALYDPALEDMPYWVLAEWIEDAEKHTFAYLTDAVRAAQRAQRADQARRAERPVSSGRPVEKPEAVVSMLKVRDGAPAKALRETLALRNCGKTSGAILHAIDPTEETLDKQLARKDVYYGQDDVDRLHAVLTKVPGAGQVLLLDCTLVTDHSFLLEIHPDGRRYLYQSYQAVYSVHWWAGTEGDEGLYLTHDGKRPEDRFQADLARVRKARDDYGKGRRIAEEPWKRFVTAMLDAHRTGKHEALADQWTTLPFAPTEAQATTLRRWQAEPKVRILEFLFTGLPDSPNGSVAGAALPAKL
ncbi:hypothetical protein Ade02nite_80930 [Paractinoplanes deccanensis]|uniref:Uncharacterized protein n=1 Tax=Paractinoplanes deccanensis TaxID=113561 RepID=A0ABQ3YHI9_9ACTN|nr:hypothetical protein [Actinoplanes deccanensis]GID79452.1 hypothetical protein Ade02nite_80930 [Actinoplanes deccanensis]